MDNTTGRGGGKAACGWPVGRFPDNATVRQLMAPMAEYGEWSRKGAALSDITAQKNYGVTRDFIIQGVRAGELECKDSSIWGNPSLKILRSQLELYIAKQLGAEYLAHVTTDAELRAVNGEIRATRKKLATLEARKTALESVMQQPHGGPRSGGA